MKTINAKISRIIPWVGIAVVAGALVAAATYVDLERKTNAAEAYNATLDRLNQEQQLSSALKKIHDGDVAQAAQYLDLLLCGDILLTNTELASADTETRAIVQNTFRRLAMVRPKTDGAEALSRGEHITDRIAAERILKSALAAPKYAEKK